MNRKISDKSPATYLPKIVNDSGQAPFISQCIPLNKELWEIDSYESFLKERRLLIANRLNEFLDE